MSKLEEDLVDSAINATEQLRYSMRNTEARRDPWIPAAERSWFSDYAVALIELLGNEQANAVVSEAVITALGSKLHNELRREWISNPTSWIDMCIKALRDAGKEVP